MSRRDEFKSSFAAFTARERELERSRARHDEPAAEPAPAPATNATGGAVAQESPRPPARP